VRQRCDGVTLGAHPFLKPGGTGPWGQLPC
jgi:hypothetical protein